MPVVCDWYDEAQAIIALGFIGNWTTEELLESNKTLLHLPRQVTTRFDIISDFLQAAYTPPTGVLWEWKQMAIARHHEFPNWGFTVYVTNSGVMQAYINEGIDSTDAIQQHARLARTIEEAVQIIQADRHNRKSALHG
jgi:hypothetical protein